MDIITSLIINRGLQQRIMTENTHVVHLNPNHRVLDIFEFVL